MNKIQQDEKKKKLEKKREKLREKPIKIAKKDLPSKFSVESIRYSNTRDK